ncbi:STAS domain-containing protein [Uliginosibacterium sp. H1]|uniref:STAS domain-containing protein n=1 Tax=Uliginosibacterium sp. H1 TaxID=3114757 RepID=UPI002E185B03|nr:STAS domain-containing protein [Uliginosibacterium sp. H1]
MSGFNYAEPRLGVLALEGELTIMHASDIKDVLLDRLAASDKLDVDLAGISEIDSAGVQLLMMLRNEAERASKQVSWVGHSQAVTQVLDLLNLGAALGAPAAIVWS